MKYKEIKGKTGDIFLNYLPIELKDINAEGTGFNINNLKTMGSLQNLIPIF